MGAGLELRRMGIARTIPLGLRLLAVAKKAGALLSALKA